MKEKPCVMIAGIGGASLGTELLKCLSQSGEYRVFGCDISNLAYGHYEAGFEKTFLIDRTTYVESILDVCQKSHIEYIIPGGEEPMVLLGEVAKVLNDHGITLVANSTEVSRLFSNKERTFKTLSELGFQIPLTKSINQTSDLEDMIFPCVIKPSTGTGGSAFVFLAADKHEARAYVEYLITNEKAVIAQEYVPEAEGEFTVGVLSLPGGQIACSVALKRIFDSKLSVLAKSSMGLISSGYSQGLIDDFPEVRVLAEKIAQAVDSQGPLNVQGRIKNGVFLPFEINPRFSASTYLRALAGVNEIDIYLQYLVKGIFDRPKAVRPGYYLRSLTELYVDKRQSLQ